MQKKDKQSYNLITIFVKIEIEIINL